jgi:hypothetical protein
VVHDSGKAVDMKQMEETADTSEMMYQQFLEV